MRPKKPTTLAAAMLAAVLTIAGCGATGETPSTALGSGTEVAAAAASSGDTDGATAVEATSSPQLVAATEANQVSHADADDLNVDPSDVVEITLSGTAATADSGAVTTDGTTVTISEAGTYSLSGTLADGQVIVAAADTDDVTLILDGVDITNSDGAAIAVMTADEAVVLLADGSTNQLTDGASYSFPDSETDEPNATLYSATDLTIGGTGQLTVNANYNDGITSKDGLAIEGGTISVTAVDDGIRGKDYVIVEAGAISISAGGDGIKADNEEDAERGYVLIADGVVGIVSGDDGVQGATDVLISGGELTIDAGAASESGRAVQAEVLVVISGGTIDAVAADDAIHSNDEITIDGGTITLAAGDDGVHGDYLVTINGGSITITEAFEGIESEVITINDGFINVTSSDDGLNVASAETTTGTTAETSAAGPGNGRGARPGGGPGGGDDAVGEHYIYINGGTTVITITGDLAEQGDGIDANGHVEMTGGVVAVSGPTDTRNSAIDYSGGSFELTGGLFIGTNVDGRNSEGVGSGSSQPSIYLTSTTTISPETLVQITTTDGDNLVSFEPANAYSVVVFSSPDLVDGQAYNVYLGGTTTGDSATSLYEASSVTLGELSSTVTATL